MRTPPTSPPATRRSVRDGKAGGILIVGVGTKGRLEGCDVARNEGVSLSILNGADPLVTSCTYVIIGMAHRPILSPKALQRGGGCNRLLAGGYIRSSRLFGGRLRVGRVSLNCLRPPRPLFVEIGAMMK